MRKGNFRKFLYFISKISQKSESSKIVLERGFEVIFKNKYTYFLTGMRKLMASYTKPQPTAALIIIPNSQLLDYMPKQIKWQSPGIIVWELSSCIWICHIAGLSLCCSSSSSSRRPFPFFSTFFPIVCLVFIHSWTTFYSKPWYILWYTRCAKRTSRLWVQVLLRWADGFRKHTPADMENAFLEPSCWGTACTQSEAFTNTHHTPLVKYLLPITRLGSFPE